MPKTAKGTDKGPRFIFGRLNTGFKAKRKGDSSEKKSAATDQSVETLRAIRKDVAKTLGRDPKPKELQDAYRRRLMRQVRGRLLVKMMQENKGKTPDAAAYRDRLNAWRENNLMAHMKVVNDRLGTKGSGYPGGGINPKGGGGPGQKRLDAAAKAAPKAAQSTESPAKPKAGSSTDKKKKSAPRQATTQAPKAE